TVGAAIAGARLASGAATSRFVATVGDRIGSLIIGGCAPARSTEIDDIHLASCTTPGAVLVPTVLALGAMGRLRALRGVCAAALAGYEALIRVGVAGDGPIALHHGIWPTHAAATFGSAAAASRAYRLTREGTMAALTTALAFGSGRPVPGAPPSSS